MIDYYNPKESSFIIFYQIVLIFSTEWEKEGNKYQDKYDQIERC